MKRHFIKNPSNQPIRASYDFTSDTAITEDDVYQYLQNQKVPESTLSDNQIKKMAKEIISCIHKEEMLTGEPYESIEEADIPELCDGSTTDLHDLYYNLIFGPDMDVD